MPADLFPKLEEANIEAEFLDGLRAIEGCSDVETQTYTIAKM